MLFMKNPVKIVTEVVALRCKTNKKIGTRPGEGMWRKFLLIDHCNLLNAIKWVIIFRMILI